MASVIHIDHLDPKCNSATLCMVSELHTYIECMMAGRQNEEELEADTLAFMFFGCKLIGSDKFSVECFH